MPYIKNLLWNRVFRRPALFAIRLADISIGHVYVSSPFQRIRSTIFSRNNIPTHVRTAIVVHVYYPELWHEIMTVRKTISFDCPIIVTAPPDQAACLRKATVDDPTIGIVETPNRGRDIAPFLYVLGTGRLDSFDAVLKIHTKKSPHLRQGDLRRRVLFSALAGSRSTVARIINQFQCSKVGMVGPSLYFRTSSFYWMNNRSQVKNLTNHLRIPLSLGFFEGTMFWFRPASLQKLRTLSLDFEIFDKEESQLDGALHHAVERIFSITAASAGYETRSLGGRTLMTGKNLT